MATDGRAIAILDTSVLVNFLAVDRADLLANHPFHRFAITDHVRGEVTEGFPDELTRLDAAIEGSIIELISLQAMRELESFALLVADGRLGVGECAAIAAGSVRGAVVAIDDKVARKRALGLDPAIQLSDTAGLIVDLIKGGLLVVASADDLKMEWETKYRFKLKFRSFAELI